MFPDKTGVSSENERRPGTKLLYKGYEWHPKQINLSRTLVELPDTLKNIQIPKEIQMNIMVSHTYQLLSKMNR